ncbi:MAG: HNH endonuclease [Planctomycetaceae bacterium]|jgi:hypothetical protein|nr:HNH endonuclease [Planctomycetaceae bacterium]
MEDELPIFVPEDLNAFAIDSPRECVDRVRSDILPKLRAFLQFSKKRVREVYGIEPNDTKRNLPEYPNPRPTTSNPQKPEYASIALSGKVVRCTNTKINRTDGKPANFSHCELLYGLTAEGDLSVILRPFWFADLPENRNIVSEFSRFYADNWDMLDYILGKREIDRPEKKSDINDFIFETEYKKDKKFFNCRFKSLYFNIKEEDWDNEFGLDDLSVDFTALYPLFEVGYCLERGESVEHIPAMLEKFKLWYDNEYIDEENESDTIVYNEEIDNDEFYSEGAVTKITVNRYERSRKARDACVKKYGCACSVCGFDFEKTYGEIGKKFIHVHHLQDIATIGREYELTPDDLQPICPNCHAMLHTQKPAIKIDILKTMIKEI